MKLPKRVCKSKKHVTSEGKVIYKRWGRKEDVDTYHQFTQLTEQAGFSIEEFFAPAKVVDKVRRDILITLCNQHSWTRSLNELYLRFKKLTTDQSMSVREYKLFVRLTKAQRKDQNVDLAKLQKEFPGKSLKTLQDMYSSLYSEAK